MLINTQIQLELDKIKIGENPMNKKGKFIEYEFRMIHPSQYYFFKKPKVGDDDFTIFWGQSPTIVFYKKDFKPLERQIHSLIKGDLPDGFKIEHVNNWRISISGYTSPKNDRDWGLFYHAETYYNKDRVCMKCERHIGLSKDFMARLQSELPTKWNEELEII